MGTVAISSTDGPMRDPKQHKHEKKNKPRWNNVQKEEDDDEEEEEEEEEAAPTKKLADLNDRSPHRLCTFSTLEVPGKSHCGDAKQKPKKKSASHGHRQC